MCADAETVRNESLTYKTTNAGGAIDMMEFVDVNGAKIERSYLEENVAEAKECEWSVGSVEVADDHVHCIVCDVAMSKGVSAFRADNRWLCQYCMEHFVMS